MRSNAKGLFSLILLFCSITELYPQDVQKADSLRSLLYNSTLSEIERLEIKFKLYTFSPSVKEQLSLGNEILATSKESNNIEYLIKGYQAIGVSNRLLGNLGSAFENLFKAAELAVGHSHDLLLSDVYTELSTCFTLSSNSVKAIEYGEKSIEIQKKLTPFDTGFGINLLNLAYDHYLLGYFEKAEKLNNEANEIFNDNDFEIGQLYVLGNNALVKWKQGNINLAKQHLTQTISDLHDLEDWYAIADFKIQLAKIYAEEDNWDEVIKLCNEAIVLAKRDGLKEQLRDANQLLSEAYAIKDDYQSSLTYSDNYHAYKDSIYNQETADLLANLNAEFELAKKQGEVDLLKFQRKNNQLVIIAAMVIIVSLLVIAWLLARYSRSKERLNRQLQDQKSNLIQLNETKDKFFSIVSHDLRGPIGVVSGLAGVLKRDVSILEEEELKELIHHVDNSASNLVKLLDNLLHWSLQQRGSLPYEPENTNCYEVCDEVISLFTEMASEKSIKLELNSDKESTVYVDRNALSTILRNLINNAIKFSESNSTIRLDFQTSDSNTGIFRVTDQGIGMSKEFIEGFLSSNNQISSSGTNGEKGLGIGLQLVKEFLQINKGTLEVRSLEGEGTTFEITLPTLP